MNNILSFLFRPSDAQCVKQSGFFDAKWYLSKYPDLNSAKIDPLEHYLKFGGYEGRFPSPHFDSKWYLSQYPDIDGLNPLVHYIRFGKKKGYKPLAALHHSRVAQSGEGGLFFSIIGQISSLVRRIIFLLIFKARKISWGITRNCNKIQELCSYSPQDDFPQVSVLMPTYGCFDNVEKSLKSMLEYPQKKTYEVLIINDNPAKDKHLLEWAQNQADLLKRNKAKVYTSSMNMGFVSSVNILSRKANGRWLFLLNDDTEICSLQWLDALADTILSDKNIGAVGSLLLFPGSHLVNHAVFIRSSVKMGRFGMGIFLNISIEIITVKIEREVPMLTGAAFFISKELFVELGRLDEGYR